MFNQRKNKLWKTYKIVHKGHPNSMKTYHLASFYGIQLTVSVNRQWKIISITFSKILSINSMNQMILLSLSIIGFRGKIQT